MGRRTTSVKRILKSIISIAVASTALIIPTSASVCNAERIPEYVTPDGDDLKDLFELNTGDITDIFSWLNDRSYFTVIEQNDYKDQVWVNVPNLQSLIYGKVDGIFATGYTENGVDIDQETKGTMYETDSDGQTAMKQLGFTIPNLTYRGEYPVIQYSLSSVLPHGVWGTIKSAIKGLFGGSFIDPPEAAEDFATLEYINLNDYKEDYATCLWIEDHWDETCAELEDGQVLLPKSLTGNKEGKIDGVNYTFETCIKDNDLETVEGTPEEFNRKLKTTFGQYYEPIMTCMFALEPGEEGSTLTKFTLRNMPYDSEYLNKNGGVITDLAKDPRCDADAYFSIVHQEDNHQIANTIRPFIISIFAFISKFTLFIDQITDFSILEDAGLDLEYFLTGVIIRVIFTLFLIMFVIKLVKYIISYLSANGSNSKIFVKIFTGLGVCLVMSAFIINPNKTYNTFKNVANLPEKISVVNFDDNKNATFASDASDDRERYELSYWVPYFEMWSVYNTNHSLNDDSQIIDLNSGQNEVEEMALTKIGDNDNTRWDVLLAQSFTNGFTVDRNAYRCIDHYLAPRFDIDFDDSTVITTENENYNGDIQTRIGFNWLIIIDVFIAELIKIFLFINLLIEFGFLIVFLIFRYGDEGAIPTLKTFGFSFLLYTISVIFVPVVSNFTYMGNSEALPCFVLTVFFVLVLVFAYKALGKLPEWTNPRLILAIKKKNLKRNRKITRRR